MEEEQNLDTQDVQPTESEQPEDIRDVVAREFDKLEAKEAEKAEPAPEPKRRGRPPKVREPEPEPEVQAQAEEPEPQEAAAEEPEAEPEQEQPKRNPFASWKKEAQTVLAALPPETQQYIIDREQQFHKGIQQYKTDAMRGRSFGAAVEPHMEYLNQLGVAPEMAFSKLIETEKALRTGDEQTKARMLMALAHDYGIDINSLTNVPFDPYRHQLEQQLAQQQAQLAQLSQSRQMAEETQVNQTIEHFAMQHEHFDTVRETMADLLDKGLASDLDDAYMKALPWHGLNAQAVQPMQQNPIIKANNAAKVAKASAVSVKGAPTGVTKAPEPRTTEEAVRQAMAQLGL